MPSDHDLAVALKGTAAYAAFLDDLAAAVGAPNRSALAERALAELGRRHGLDAPPRVTPAGWSRRPKARATRGDQP